MATNPLDLKRTLKSAVMPLAALSAVLLLGHYSYWAVLFAAFSMWFAFGSGLLVVLIALVLVFQRSAKNWRAFRLAAAAFAYFVAMTAGLAHGKKYLDSKLERSFAPVIQALEQHKQRYGRYPDTLDAVMRNPPSCPTRFRPYHHLRQEKTDGVDRYCITCITVVFLKHSYCSDKPRWHDWD